MEKIEEKLLEGQFPFACVKHNRRLFIKNLLTEELLYTHPDFIRPLNRISMINLAKEASQKGFLDIVDIMKFEFEAPRARGYERR